MKDVLRDRGWTEVEGEDDSWNLFWCEVSQLRSTLDHRRLDSNQKVRHFRNHYELTRKNLLSRNIKKLRRTLLRQGRTQEAEMCDCVPVTFELPSEHLMFVEEFRRRHGTTWIIKPSSGSQGRGIFIFQKCDGSVRPRRLKELSEWRLAREAAAQNGCKPDSRGSLAAAAAAPAAGPGAGPGAPDSLTSTADQEVAAEVWVVQMYVDKPYLIADKKFDIRFYVLVTSFRPLKVWMAREGFARMCGEPYNLRALNNQRGHLTNMSIQLKGNETDVPGCKWGLRRLRQFLTAEHGAAAIDRLFQRIAHVVMTSLRSVQQAILQDRHCFELYGYDVLLDEDLNPWLLEVNASPSLTATDPEDYRLKYQLLEDVLNVIDMEGNLSGQERQVGGLDLLWDDGPVFRRCPEGACGVTRPQPANECRPLNVMLGCYNNRAEQLEELARWRVVVAQHVAGNQVSKNSGATKNAQ
ncbi:hypothetical protein ONE63_006302 [Megalurothrips usitatus]|uniref:Tubulin--tyrosine ligase-like protein 9 n=1 Tax=Megalurothrips usitatus TaxID=439358 RepID=A0AAV7XTL5_9NEOP|nr:hypothetical protein ONE63_006302 [Megalurothrips usitatus]